MSQLLASHFSLCKTTFTMVCLTFWLGVHAQTENVRINEIVALNQTGLMDEDGEYSDWIELYNPTKEDVNLLGWSLSNNADLPQQWFFPNRIIGAGEYLMVFASGKSRDLAYGELHTNFQLSGSGEFLALYNANAEAVSVLNPFPEQQTDISYGVFNNGFVYFTAPTPETNNELSTEIQLPAPVFSINHGFFDTPFSIEFYCSVPTAAIYYTTDGSTPSADNGTIYVNPLTVSKTSILRAMAIIDGKANSRVNTQTYIFVEDIIRQPNNPDGYPAEWGPYTRLRGNAIGDYEMDPELMSDPAFAERAKTALKDIPTISLVSDKGNFFNNSTDSLTGGIYIYTGPSTGSTGEGWERPVSFEYFDARDSVSFRADCGISIHGGQSRLAEKCPKHSFTLKFKGIYGPTKLRFPLFGDEGTDEFNSLILRAGYNNTWLHSTPLQRGDAQYTRDNWSKDTQLNMGHIGSHNSYAHLYINGIYWGLYSPTERVDDDFAESYLKGTAENFDVIENYTELAAGTLDAWNNMMAIARSGMAPEENYQLIQGNNPDGSPAENLENYLDVVNLIDYMLINYYSGNIDWDHHNWSAIRNRTKPGKGFIFVNWDAENILGTITQNVLNNNNYDCPSELFNLLKENRNFKLLLADRIQKHCYDNGLLSPENAALTWQNRADQISQAIDAEAARWGDYRRDVHPYQYGPYELYTKDNQYLTRQNFMLETYFPERTDIFISQLRAAGLFPNIDAPTFAVNDQRITDGIISGGDLLDMSAPQGTIYYTLDGSDPMKDDAFSESAISYAQPIELDGSVRVKAITYYNGEWSAVNDQFLIVPADYKDIKVTEVHYNPLADENGAENRYEFLEIKNTGNAILNLENLSFIDGIRYQFALDTELQPGSFVVLASNEDAFYNRYGFWPFDEYEGQLSNDGEWIKAVASTGSDTIINFKYNDGFEWPQASDGAGNSLVPMDINPTQNQNIPAFWRASYAIGGSPGMDDDNSTALHDAKIIESNIAMLSQNYPNPFTDHTYIDFKLSGNASVQLTVYDVMGQKIATLIDGFKPVGMHQVEWNGKGIKPGIYIYQLRVNSGANNTMITKKMLKR